MLLEIQVHLVRTWENEVLRFEGLIHKHVFEATKTQCTDLVHKVVGSIVLDHEILVHPT